MRMIGNNHQQSDSITGARVRWSYLKTRQGYLKALHMVLSLICFATTTFARTPYSTWFVTVAISGFAITGILLASHLIGADEKYPNFPWSATEYVCSGTLAVCNYVAACSIALFTSKTNALILAVSAFFSFATIGVYVVDAWLMHRAIVARKKTVEDVRGARDPESIAQVHQSCTTLCRLNYSTLKMREM